MSFVNKMDEPGRSLTFAVLERLNVQPDQADDLVAQYLANSQLVLVSSSGDLGSLSARGRVRSAIEGLGYKPEEVATAMVQLKQALLSVPESGIYPQSHYTWLRD